MKTNNQAGREKVENRWHGQQALVLIICFLINLLDGIDIVILTYIAPALTQEWGISSTSMGLVFSAGLAGMAFGGLVLAPLADRFGRRTMILFSMLIMTSGMIASAYVHDIYAMCAARLVVGAGIGTVLASMAALTSEYAPPRYRSFAVGLVQAGWPVGAVATGFITAWALPIFGWRTLILAAASLSVISLPLIFALLPESMDYLQKVQPKGALARLNKIRVRMNMLALEVLPPKPDSASRFTVAALFSAPVRHSTLLLWPGIICGFMVLYFVISWITRLALDAGLNQADSIYAGAIYNAGAFTGTLIMSALAVRLRLQTLIPVMLVAAAGLLLFFGSVKLPVYLVLLTAFVIGVALQGGFNGFHPLTSQVYPTELRSTGLGWAMGMGRIGAVAGPLLAGFIMSLNQPQWVLFAVFCVPALIAAGCAFHIQRRAPQPLKGQ
ncbi:MAG: MFS transporter [Asticcacaulis sp.]